MRDLTVLELKQLLTKHGLTLDGVYPGDGRYWDLYVGVGAPADRKPQIVRQRWYVLETNVGTEIIPADAVGALDLPEGYAFDVGGMVIDFDLIAFMAEKHNHPFLSRAATLAPGEAAWTRIRKQLRPFCTDCALDNDDALESVELVESWGGPTAASSRGRYRTSRRRSTS